MRASSGSRRRRLTTGRRRRHEYATASIATSSDTGHCAGVTRDRPVGSGWPVDSVVAWKTRAIRSVSTDALQKARFPQHLGRRRRRPQAPQALSPYSRSGRQDRISKTRYVTPPQGGNRQSIVATLRRAFTFAGISVHVRRNRCSRSAKYPPLQQHTPFLRGVSFRCRRGVNSGCRLTPGAEGTATGGSRPSCSPAISALDPCSTGRAVAGVALRRRTRVQGSRGRSRRNTRSSLGLSRECTGEDVDRQSRRRRRGGRADKQSPPPGGTPPPAGRFLDAAHVRGVHTGAENRAGVERQKAAQVVE